MGCRVRSLSVNNPAADLSLSDEVKDEFDDVAGYRDALDIAARTFQLIREYKTPPIPKAYEVLYSYASNDRQLVKERVDDAIQRYGALNLYDVEQIHSDYFSYSEAIQARHDKTAGGMEAELTNLMDLISNHSTSTDQYSKSLTVANVSLSNGVTADQLRSTIKVLMAENGRAREEAARLAASLKSSQDSIKAIKESLASAREEGLRDALTGLRNRRHFDRTLSKEIDRAQETGSPLTICMLDIDHFKRVNDDFGHPTGDSVLRLVGGMLSENLKGRDIPVRYGGEEFSIILPQTPLKAGESIADRIRAQLANKRLVLADNKTSLGVITASFGVAEWMPGEADAELIARADAMLYQAKRTGRNKVVSDTEHVPQHG